MFDTPQAAAEHAASLVAESVLRALASRGRADVALAGGTTPRAAYEALGPMVPDWSGVHLWLGDERLVPPDDPQSNGRLVAESLRAPGAVLHRIPEGLDPAATAARYGQEMAGQVPRRQDGLPALDMALLGLGEDGHTASLFPGDPAVALPPGEVCVAVHASKPPPLRVTLTLPVLAAATARVMLASGSGKAAAVARVLAGPDPAVPASLLPARSTVLVVDRAAVGAP